MAGVPHGCDGLGLLNCSICSLSVPPADLISYLYHKEGMIPQRKLSRTVEHCDEVSCDNTGRRLVGSCDLSRVEESNPIPLDWLTGDRSPRDMVCGPLKEVLEERVTQLVLHGM